MLPNQCRRLTYLRAFESRSRASRFSHIPWAAKLQPESQKLLRRLRATSHDRDFHRKIRRTEGETWGLALPPAVWCGVARRMARPTVEPLALLNASLVARRRLGSARWSLRKSEKFLTFVTFVTPSSDNKPCRGRLLARSPRIHVSRPARLPRLHLRFGCNSAADWQPEMCESIAAAPIAEASVAASGHRVRSRPVTSSTRDSWRLCAQSNLLSF
jgi:hypothetical protein